MALHYDFTKIENYEPVCWQENGNIQPVTDALVWLTVGCELGEITEENYRDFFARIKVFEKLFGAFLYGEDGKDSYLTEDNIKAHIGLTTNVLNKSFESFMLKISNKLKEDYKLPVSGVPERMEHLGLLAQKLATDISFGADEDLLEGPDFRDSFNEALDNFTGPAFRSKDNVEALQQYLEESAGFLSYLGVELRCNRYVRREASEDEGEACG